MEIIEGIHRIDEASNNMAHSNVYLVIDGKELIVIDTGMAGNAKKILKYIQGLGYQPSDVSTIILTHYHMDHAGSVKDLKDQTNAKVAVHSEDAEIVEGKKSPPKPKTMLMRAVNSLNKPKPVEVEIVLNDGDKVGSLTVIFTPGHSPGSIALLDAEKKALFVGDTLRFDGAKVVGAPKQFTWDETVEWASIEKLSKLDFEIMLPGHGEILTKNGSGAVREYFNAEKKT
jgi:glyoxylase-like metal-dependent hydrolase (beta-lactamase superfamily II)